MRVKQLSKFAAMAALIFPMVWLPAAFAQSAGAPKTCPGWMNQTLPRLQDDKPQSLCQYAGKVVLVVNTASRCGYTNQYEGLERLSREYADRGLVVLGFPSNDFGAQEPGSNAQIADFCQNTFNVKFPMFAKSSVKGAAANPVFAYMGKATGQTPEWNFHKYLVGRDGATVVSFGSATEPGSPKMRGEIERLLAAPSGKPSGS